MIGIDQTNKFISDAFAPLAELTDDQSVIAFVERLGWTLPSAPSAFQGIQSSALALQNTLGDLRAAGRANDHGQTETKALELVGAIGALVASIETLPNSVATELPATFLQETQINNDPTTQIDQLIKKRLLDYAVCAGLGSAAAGFRTLLFVLGVVEETIFEADDSVHRPDFTLQEVRLDRLGLLISDQKALLSDVYGWGTPTLNAARLFESVGRVSTALMSQPITSYPSTAFLNGMFPGATIPPEGLGPMLSVPLLRAFGQDPIRLGMIAAPTASATDIQALALRIFGGASVSLDVSVSATLDLTFTSDLSLDTGVGILLSPGAAPTISVNIEEAASAATSGSATVQLTRKQADFSFPVFDFGGQGNISAKTFSASLSLATSPPDVSIEAGINGGMVSVSLGSADSFLQGATQVSTLTATFDLGVGWSKRGGLFVKGSGGLEVTIPLNVTLGPLALKGARLKFLADADGVKGQAGLLADIHIGPVTASVDGVGVEAELEFASGNLGPMNFAADFLPPTGIGVVVDAGSVHGGGFISIDTPNNRYFGGLQLSVYDIAVTAFALIETPSSGYSFVIVISAQFTPIQLGFGFTLNGVGGMVGINRGIDTNALANLVRAGQSEELLFPKNVVSDAPTIVKDLTAVFPATQGQYVFGPLGKLGWGTPTLITGEIGIVLEYPAMVVVLLGEVKCLLPKPDQALVKLNLSIDGVLDFPNKTFSMDADLHDSVINGFPVSGQMAMRVSWGDQPNFVFSIGGFHPAYTPPPNFPKLQPMTLDLGSHGPAKISVSGFFAVTSNTVQVGGSATLHAGGSGITLDASVSVKALFVFQPFSFEADIDASVKISFHGYGPSVHLSGQLDGPSPWHIKGEVCVSIIWWDACLGFDVTFGGNTQITAPSVDPWLGVPSSDPTAAIVGLQTALSDPGNWSGALIPGTVSSVARAQGTDTLVDPVGGLTVRQKTAPVETPNPLTKFGVAKTTAPISFSNVQATLGTGQNTVSLTAVEAVNEDFAPAQFFDMDDGKKLSSAGFEQYQAGYLFATADGKNAQGGSSVTYQPKTRTLVINSDGTDTEFDDDYKPTDPQVTAFNKQSAIAKGGLAQAGTRRFVNRAFTQSFTQILPTFVITDSTTLAVPTPAPATVPAPAAAVRSATLIALDAFRTQHVELALGVQVTALHDMPT